jgi:predicted negative regulator of RcsB-dependent stress response
VNAYVTEEEQIERLKSWISEYGATVIISIIAVIVFSFGWRYWVNHQEMARAQASEAYEDMVISMMNNQDSFAVVKADYVIKEYPSTPYAKLAAFYVAQQAVYQHDYIKANNQLQWVIQHAGSASIRQIAKIRAARVLLAAGKPQEALNLLSNPEDKAFIPATNAVRGDIYLALGNKAKAIQSYQTALSATHKTDANMLILQMKLADLAFTNSNMVA